MNRRSFLACGLLVPGWVSSASALTADDWLSWRVSRRPDMKGAIGLTMRNGILDNGKTSRPFSAESQAELFHDLDMAGLWELTDCNPPDWQKGRALYTELVVHRTYKVSETHWRGAGLAQLRLADGLFWSPLGPEARELIAQFAPHLPPPPPLPPDADIFPILLEKVSVNRLIPILHYAFTQVEFSIDPSCNAFYARGLRKDVLNIKAMVESFDQLPFLCSPLVTSSDKGWR